MHSGRSRQIVAPHLRLFPDRQYQSIALHIGGIRNLALGKLEAKHILRLGEGYGMSEDNVITAVDTLEKRLPKALEAVEKSPVGGDLLKNQLMEKMEKRWNGSFKLTGHVLWKKRSKGAKRKS